MQLFSQERIIAGYLPPHSSARTSRHDPSRPATRPHQHRSSPAVGNGRCGSSPNPYLRRIAVVAEMISHLHLEDLSGGPAGSNPSTSRPHQSARSRRCGPEPPKPQPTPTCQHRAQPSQHHGPFPLEGSYQRTSIRSFHPTPPASRDLDPHPAELRGAALRGRQHAGLCSEAVDLSLVVLYIVMYVRNSHAGIPH